MAAEKRGATPWQNWAGNQSCMAQEFATPTSEDEVSDLVRSAADRQLSVRVAAGGHSFTPVCLSDGLLLSLERMHGITEIDRQNRRATVLAGTKISELGPPLWEQGLSLRNQGDIDAQYIAGAVSTATHGSGNRLKSMSAAARRIRAVLPSGEAYEAAEDNPDLLAAAQVAVGMLGVITSVELDLAEAFLLRKHVEFWSFEEISERWEHEFEKWHHFSFFWMPTAKSAPEVFLECPADIDMADCGYVKMFEALPPGDLEHDGFVDESGVIGRPYQLYPQYCGPNFYEMEYMVPYETGKDAFAEVRRLMLGSYPDRIFPVEVRSTAKDSAYLSPNFERDSIVISVCGQGTDYLPFLADVANTLNEFDARPHWGKIHFMDAARLGRILPKYERFREIRSSIDPGGVFLNASLQDLFG
jgi:FAD/FMN-containing dehydrogenase